MRVPRSVRPLALTLLVGAALSVAEARQSPQEIGARVSSVVQDWAGDWSLERLTGWWGRRPDQVVSFSNDKGALAIWNDPPHDNVLRSRISVNVGDATNSRTIDVRIWAPQRNAVVDGAAPIVKGLQIPDEPRVLRDLAKGRGQWKKSYVWPRVEAHASEPITVELQVTKDEGHWRFSCSYVRVRAASTP